MCGCVGAWVVVVAVVVAVEADSRCSLKGLETSCHRMFSACEPFPIFPLSSMQLPWCAKLCVQFERVPAQLPRGDGGLLRHDTRQRGV